MEHTDLVSLTSRARQRGDSHLRVRAKDADLAAARYTQVEVYQAEARRLAVGDRIRWTRNDKALGRRNGEYADVVGFDPETRAVTVQLPSGTKQTLDLGRERHWDHGYAVTAHAAQGQTRDRVLVHVDTSQRQLTGREQWYVSISRAKHELTIYTDDADRLPGRISRSQQQESAMDAAERRKRTWNFERALEDTSSS